MSLLDRVAVSGPLSVLDLASMTPSPSMKFEELGKLLCTSGWFLGSFCVRSLAALIVLALMMLIAAIWVRCGLALAGLAHPLMTRCRLVVLDEVSLSLWWCSCFLVSAAAFVNLTIVFTFPFQAAVERLTP